MKVLLIKSTHWLNLVADTPDKGTLWDQLVHYVAQPGGLTVVWLTAFLVIVCIPFLLGFGVYGVIAGSPAALFQSVVYGAFTPAGSVFAILTSVGMSFLCPPLALVGAVIASAVTFVIWVATSAHRYGIL
ncbi:hypothetical protein FRC12_024692 [Ceratobasidium sp. 428]|nr:hypothetical protein FRC12_024692 [Ceratobasidium sp. 428]